MVINHSDPLDLELVHAIQQGLPLTPRPYAEIAERLATSEEAVIARIARLIARGDIRRFGIVVRHRELGYYANAMVVWDIPDGEVSHLGPRIARHPSVNLCYRRPRRPPHWNYNLFCMIHGRTREEVERHLGDLIAAHHLEATPHTLLFSRRRFKQRGACYSRTTTHTTPRPSTDGGVYR